MKMECIEFTNEKKYINQFIKLGRSLYEKKQNMQDDKELRSVLCGEHVLSKYFKLYKFLILKNKKPIGRFAITAYENDSTAYLGFFECVNDSAVAKFLFEKAYEFSKSKGFERIVGPVDASFWIKYRLKINLFDKPPYTGEPYNREYYLKLFKESGYEICEHYTSGIFDKVDIGYDNSKYTQRLKAFSENGYEIISPKPEDFDRVLKELYHLIIDLYSDFPIFKSVCEEDFLEHFKNFKLIIDMRMVKMAYFNGKPVGFYISLPNYSNLVHHTDKLSSLIKILKIRKNAKDYVMMYMGVDREHTGLGKALVQSIIEELKILQVPSIGALQRDGKITQKYAEELIEDRYEYVLLRKEIE